VSNLYIMDAREEAPHQAISNRTGGRSQQRTLLLSAPKHAEASFAPPFHEQHATAQEMPARLFVSTSKRRRFDMPPWIRPFLSLRLQFTLVFSLLLCLAVLVLCILFFHSMPFSYLVVAALLIVTISIVLVFIITGFLLRPLQQITDAAQAIALGDLKQHERLTLHRPPQNEFDRLAGSLHEMVHQLEQVEELRRDSELSFRRFFSDASHQLRTPLTSIRGFTEILIRSLKDEKADPETTRQVLQRMKGEAERMTYLINDLLTLARLDDKHPLKIRYVDLVPLARDRLSQFQARADKGRKISLELLTQGSLGIQADEESIKQLFYILLDNAFKYGHSALDSSITLQLDRGDNHAIIRVIDHGEGIEAEDLKHIFDPFYRGRQRRNGKASQANVIGTGLGLTIAATIVRAHKGTITATSTVGQGTIFTITLPCTQRMA
jgi:two-component system OmpR family sensor kinase